MFSQLESRPMGEAARMQADSVRMGDLRAGDQMTTKGDAAADTGPDGHLTTGCAFHWHDGLFGLPKHHVCEKKCLRKKLHTPHHT